jgi:methionyl-tRNA formyltransferase
LGKSVNSKPANGHRVVIFASGASWVPAILIRSTLAAISICADFELAAVCLPKRQSQVKIFCVNLLYGTFISLRSLTETAMRRKHKSPRPINMYRWAQRYRFRLLIPPEGNINDPLFIAHLRDEIKPTIALSFYCLKKFSPELLDIFNYTINYHNGLLPEYGGLSATAWSLYQEEKKTGFTFHRMTEGLDEGNILLRKELPVGADCNPFDLELEKAIMAATYIPKILRMAFDGDNGQPQMGKKNYYSMKDHLSVTVISDPSSLSKMELMKRLKAFEKLQIKISDKWYEVTGIREVAHGFNQKGKRTFITSDGVLMKAVHFRYLPFALYQALIWVKKVLEKSHRMVTRN